MAITKLSGRQEVISAQATIGFADVVDLAVEPAIDLPEGALVTGGVLIARTAFNSATTDTMVVEIDGVDLLAATSIAALGSTPFTAGSIAAITAPNTVDVIWDGTGAAPTAGSVELIVNYIIEGRAAFSEG